jgi:hypothetical protein
LENLITNSIDCGDLQHHTIKPPHHHPKKEQRIASFGANKMSKEEKQREQTSRVDVKKPTTGRECEEVEDDVGEDDIIIL